MLQGKAPTEDEKMAGLQRLSNRYQPSASPVVVKGREDYKRLKLTEAFQTIDTNRDGYVSMEELTAFLTKRGQQLRGDPNYRLNPDEAERVKALFESMDADNSGTVDVY